MRPRPVIVICGAGNTGSHGAACVARLLIRLHLPGVIVIVDPDVVTAGNVAVQDFDVRDVGLPKAEALARRLRHIAPELTVIAKVGELEDLPAGFFSGLVILAVDSNGPRRVAARRTWMMGGQLVDWAVNGPAGLARVTTVSPSAESSCLECSWDDETYAALPLRHGCRAVAPTNAPAALGALAASLGTLQVRRLLAGDGWPAESIEYICDGERSFRSVLPRNPACRFDHARMRVDTLGGIDPAQTLGSLFDVLQVDGIRVPGFEWDREACCDRCGTRQPVVRLTRGPQAGDCSSCGGRLIGLPYLSTAVLARPELAPEILTEPLSAVGLEAGEVVVGDDARQGLKLGDPFRLSAAPAAASTQ